MREGIVLYDRTVRPSGPAPTSTPAPAGKWPNSKRSTTIALNPKSMRSPGRRWP
jgi:hypothetical protein